MLVSSINQVDCQLLGCRVFFPFVARSRVAAVELSKYDRTYQSARNPSGYGGASVIALWVEVLVDADVQDTRQHLCSIPAMQSAVCLQLPCSDMRRCLWTSYTSHRTHTDKQTQTNPQHYTLQWPVSAFE